MMAPFHRLTRFALHAIVAATALAAPALALAAPPQPTFTRGPKPWVGFMFMVLLLAIVLGVSLMPSKRGHQD